MVNNDKKFHQLRLASQIKVGDKFDINPEFVKIGGVLVATLGNLSVAIGRAKSRKSFSASILTAAVLNADGRALNYNSVLPQQVKRILFADTEQSGYHCSAVLSRILKLASLPPDVHPDTLEFVSLRRYSPMERIGIIQDAIESTEGLCLVVIDGIRDLVNDINDSSESNGITNLLMKWSEEHNLHIHCILHQNKTDLHARGHLGSELTNKAESVLEVLKEKEVDRSIVKPVYCRNPEFEAFAFYVDEDGVPCIDESYIPDEGKGKARFTYESLTEADHRKVLEIVFENSASWGYSDLIERIKMEYSRVLPEPLGENKAKSVKVFLQNKRMIIQQDNKKYVFNAGFVF